MNIRTVDTQDVAGASELWQEIVDASHDGWIWHTWRTREFNLCANEKHAAR